MADGGGAKESVQVEPNLAGKLNCLSLSVHQSMVTATPSVS